MVTKILKSCDEFLSQLFSINIASDYWHKNELCQHSIIKQLPYSYRFAYHNTDCNLPG